MTNRIKTFLRLELPLITGGLIYILFRADSLVMFRWFDKLSATHLINSCRQHTVGQFNLPNWVLYSLPDALWVFSFTSCMLVIWKYKFSVQSILWIFLAPIIGLLSEIGQAFHLVRGTFDYTDLILLLIASILPFIKINHKQKLQTI